MAAVILVNLAVLTVWVLTRTVGIAIGSDGTPEAWGTIDGVCAALEGLAIVASRRPADAALRPPSAECVGGIRLRRIRGGARRRSRDVRLQPGLRGWWRAGTAADGHNHGGSGVPAAGAAATAGHTHGVATTLNGQHVHGVKAQDIAAESQPDAALDPATRAALQAQLVQARQVAERYPTVADAAAGGYGVVAGGFAPGSGAHYISYSGLTVPGEFHADRPMSLIYDGTSPTSRIVGLMYYGMGEQAPDGFAGPNDHWHRHSNVCIKGGAGRARRSRSPRMPTSRRPSARPCREA